MQDSQGQPASLGSGFVLRDGQVVTNLHVISGAASGYARLVGKDLKYDISGTFATDDIHDLTVLAVSGLKAPALPIGDSAQIAVGDEVYAVGNPRGLEGTFSQGIVSALRHIGNDTILQMTAPISPGSSGGPILNNAGKVVGIAVATYTDGQNLNLAIPVSYLVALIAGARDEVQPLQRQTMKGEKRSIIGDLGGPSAQGVVAEKFAWDQPTLEDWGWYSFSLRNQLRETVGNLRCLIIFRDAGGQPIDASVLDLDHIQVLGLLAKRVSGVPLIVDSSVRRLTRKVEIRVLDFRFVE